jgi:hypothetical protein
MTAASAPLQPQAGSYVDWPAILAGAVVAAGIGVLCAGFGAALGLSAVSAEEGEGSASFGLVLTGLWLLVSTVAAYAAGGYIAGRMRRRVDGATADEVSARDSIHGVVVWAIGILIGGWLAAAALGTAATAVGGAAQSAATAVSGIAQGAGQMAAGAVTGTGDAGLLQHADPMEIITNRLTRETGAEVEASPELASGAAAVMVEVARTGEITEDDKSYLGRLLAENSTLTQEQAGVRIDQAVAEVVDLRNEAAERLEQAEQTARDAAEAARRATVLTGFAVAAAMAIAFAAAMWGANVGGRHRDEGLLFGGFRSF